jgi:hypothetical protein
MTFVMLFIIFIRTEQSLRNDIKYSYLKEALHNLLAPICPANNRINGERAVSIVLTHSDLCCFYCHWRSINMQFIQVIFFVNEFSFYYYAVDY